MAEVLRVKSLQRKVTVITSVAIAAALVLGVHGAQKAEQLEQRNHLDMHLAEVAQTVVEFCKADAVQASLSPGAPAQHYAPPDANLDLSFQVWMRQGPTLLKTNIPGVVQPLMALGQFGFVNAMVEGKPGRVFALPSADHSYTVQVAEQFEDRDNDTQTLLHYYFLPIALPLLFAMVATWFLLRRSADALDELVYRLRHLDLNNMQPVAVPQATHEMLPVIQEFNSVFQRASSALQSEQRFTAMAAHELRTPWAGIKAQAQLALGARDAQDRQEALQAVIGGVNRASHVFDQLFDLTRLDSSGRDLTERFAQVPLAAVCQQVLDDLQPRAQARQMQVHTRWGADSVYGLDFALFLLLRNLLSNAILYGEAGGRIEVSSALQDGRVILCVDDAGPGIPEQDRAKAFERFNRLGQRGTEGVGLGLSIVQMAVALHQGSIALQDSPLGGLRVRVSLAGAPPDGAATHTDKQKGEMT
jgi:signal transduction histidine kinase